jgi:hypothetical protein
MSLATVTANPVRPAMRAAAQSPATIAALFDGLAPDWHSQWAWDNYESTILALAQHYGLRRVCEIGGGRDPLYSAEQAHRRGLELTVNDIDAGELALTPAGLKTACFDIAGNGMSLVSCALVHGVFFRFRFVILLACIVFVFQPAPRELVRRGN